MTPLKYLVQSGVGNNSEILALKREHPEDFQKLIQMAREEMKNNNIEIEEPVKS